MREGWEVKTLDDLCSFSNGLWKGKKPPYINVGVIRNTNFTKEGYLDDTNIAYLDVEEKQFSSRSLNYGDIILEKSGGGPKQAVGRVIIFNKATGDFSFSNFTAAIRVNDPDILEARFLHKYLHWQYLSGVTERMQSHSTGIRNLKLKEYKSIEIPLPPLAEQKRIVAVLDEAFAGIKAAAEAARKNLASARELFESSLEGVFGNESVLWADNTSQTPSLETKQDSVEKQEIRNKKSRTGGRAATSRHILGKLSLSVGAPSIPVRAGWKWTSLTELAQMESGHTPSRRHPEYWGGDVPWIGIKDARNNHGSRIVRTLENTNQLGLSNSSSRLLPANTVCLSRTASVGYVVVMGKPMATSQDFVNWICGEQLLPEFLQFLFVAQGKEIFKFSSGSVHQTIYYPEAKAFCVSIPSKETQAEICEFLKAVKNQTQALEALYQRKLDALEELKQSLLQKAFAGELTHSQEVAA